MAGANGLEPPSSATSVATPGRLTGRASARSSSSKRSRPRVTERRYRGSGSANAPAALLAGAALRSLHLVQLAAVERLTVEKQAPHGFVSQATTGCAGDRTVADDVPVLDLDLHHLELGRRTGALDRLAQARAQVLPTYG